MKVKTAELIGPALDWAVGTAEGREIDHDFTLAGIFMPGWFIQMGSNYWKPLEKYSPRQKWEQGGPIIERERINLRDIGGDEWLADDSLGCAQYGPTPLIAAMRCYCASKLGDEVDMPEELK